MSPLDALAPDQRAVVALVLQQGRSYDEIAALLGIPAATVRGRAHAGLAALAPGNGLPGEITGPLADYLLGQQPAADAEATRTLLAESAPARAWARDLAERLDDVAPAALPEIPAAAAAPPASRLGGVVLIAGVLAVVGVVLFFALRDGDDPAGSAPAATATPAPSAAAPRVADAIELRPTAGGDATGTMTVYLQGEDQLGFELLAEKVPPSGERSVYAVWFTGPGGRARRLGFTDPVGENGRLGIQGPSENDVARFPRLFATFENVVVSRESTEDAERPSDVVLSGTLPSGR